MSDSIIDNNKACHVCGAMSDLEVHHVWYGTSNRKKADDDGLWVYLCPECHRGRYGVHGYDGYDLNRQLKQEAERAWIRKNEKTITQFVHRYGKNYL